MQDARGEKCDERKEQTMADKRKKDMAAGQDTENTEDMTVTLTLDDGTDLECVVLTIFEAGDKEYIALLPLDGMEAEEGEEIGRAHV